MTIYILTPSESLRRADRLNTWLISAADADAAKNRAARMSGDVPGTFADWFVTELLDDPSQDCVIEGNGKPVGPRGGSVWHNLKSGGDPLAI